MKCTCKGAVEIMNCEKDCPGWCGDEENPANYSNEIHFTPGVPTEDGWYVVRYEWSGDEGYATIHVVRGHITNPSEIISHAKLPEL